MTRHDTAQQTTDSRQLIITTQAYTRHDTTRRDGIHDPCVRRVAGETSARCHARSSQHGRSVRRIGEKWPTRHRPQGVVISGGQWRVPEWALVVSLPSAGVLLLRRWSMASTPGTSHSPNSSKCHPPSLATVTFRPAPPLACLLLVNLDRAERPQAHPVRSVANESENLLTYWC